MHLLINNTKTCTVCFTQDKFANNFTLEFPVLLALCTYLLVAVWDFETSRVVPLLCFYTYCVYVGNIADGVSNGC